MRKYFCHHTIRPTKSARVPHFLALRIERKSQNAFCSPDQTKYVTPQQCVSKVSQGIVARAKTLVRVCREIFLSDFCHERHFW